MGGRGRITGSAEETFLLGESLGKELLEGDVILLFGDYGVGKTEFIRGIVHGYLGEEASHQVASPSFALLHVYDHHDRRVCHYDFYRLSEEQLSHSKDLFQEVEDHDVVCVEWAEGLCLPRFHRVIKVHISMVSLESREIHIEKVVAG